jgi:hypothetical protein
MKSARESDGKFKCQFGRVPNTMIEILGRISSLSYLTPYIHTASFHALISLLP